LKHDTYGARNDEPEAREGNLLVTTRIRYSNHVGLTRGYLRPHALCPWNWVQQLRKEGFIRNCDAKKESQALQRLL
jgi:hypothetical protein